ncbi:Mediator complex subunit Med30 metazoa [Trinorchestia longiramus]|nr:Mediator complex subunit Med30 metazoa [Trinorchestia longiramus]
MSVNTNPLRVGYGGAMGMPQQSVNTSGSSVLQPTQSSQQQSPGNTSSNVVSGGTSGGTGGAGCVSASAENSQQINTLSFCKVGAETVQDIVSRTIELFSLLKSIQLPNGTPNGTQLSVDNRTRIQDNINRTRHLFKRLHIIYAKVNEDCSGMDYTPIESLIPYRDDVESRPDLKKKSDSYRHHAEEVQDLKEQLCMRSRYLKDIIDELRKIIWQINAMLATRATS